MVGRGAQFQRGTKLSVLTESNFGFAKCPIFKTHYAQHSQQLRLREELFAESCPLRRQDRAADLVSQTGEAYQLYGLGYEIEPRRDSKGRDHGFEIRGVSDELLEKYSVRSAQRDAAIERFTVEHGRKPTNNEVAVLVRESRADKLAEISTEKLRKQQLARLLPEESHALKHLHQESYERAGMIPHELSQAAESLQHAKEHLFERSSVVREHELMTEALRHGRGKIDRRQLRGALELEQSQGALIRAGNNLATRESLEREQRMIAAVDGGIGRYERLGGKREFNASERLREEQLRAVHQILDSQDFAVNLRGAAGTGKTATLTEIARGLREAGREVLAVAPTRGAVEELQKVGFRDAMTISRLLEDHKGAGRAARQSAGRG